VLTALDGLVFASYALAVLGIGWLAARRVQSAEALYTGDRRVPAWAIAVSVVATSVSGATFIGGPQQAYASNLTYLSASIASVLGAVLVAWLLLPKFYAARATTVYEPIGARHGPFAQKSCAAAFLLGRLLASGSRLYIAAVPCSLIVFGDLETAHLLGCVAVLGTLALIYTSWGGIRAVIWTDALQALVMVVAVVASIWVLVGQIGVAPSDLPAAIANADPTGDKLVLIDLSWDLGSPFTLWAVLLGLTLFNAAAFGTDQDLAQRLLTSRSAPRAAWSLIASSLLGTLVVGLFLCVGLLLFVRDAADGAVVQGDTRGVYLAFILDDLPTGLRGLLVAGLFAAAMSSTDSALNAMSSSVVVDLGFGKKDAGAGTGRLVNAACGTALIVMACVFVLAEGGKSEGLIPFALGVMIYAYAGLLGVFVSTLLLGRGSATTVLCALIYAATTVAVLQFAIDPAPSLGWRMLAGFLVSLVVCSIAKGPQR
jgi:SSS family transporter